VVAPSGIGARVVSIAMSYQGYRYVYGGASPSTGFDCRGFTYWVYLKAGRPIPITLAGQYATGARISRASLQPGDLVFFANTYKAGLSHVGIYIGNGRMINAQSESVGVVTASIDSNYWASRFIGGRRP
jgi:cell wall-associated NlpC family hydrolase